MIEAQLLSKIIDENSFFVLNKYNVQKQDFHTYPDVYDFIKQYNREFGQTPDYRTVVAEYEDFDYMAEVHDSFAYLAKTVKGSTAKRKSVEVLEGQVNEKYNSLSGIEFANWLYNQASDIKAIAQASSSTGTNYAVNGQERKEWYRQNQEEKESIYIPTPYESLTRWLGGGFALTDYILLNAYTNRGKSWLSSDMAVAGWKAGFGVIYYSPELSKEQQIYRFDTLNGHYNNVQIRRGELENEQDYLEYLDGFNEDNEVPFIVKSMEDLPDGLSTDVIQSDLSAHENIGMVVIDGFNLMNHGKGSMRDGMTRTSRELRQIFGKYRVAGLVTHQTPTSAEQENMNEDEETGIREVVPPRIDQYSETVSTVQDPATVLTFDQQDGVGKLLLAKCREPNVGEELELRCNFNYGYITEATPVSIF